jgi:uncharacterized protein (DUF983 family)
MKKGTKLYSVVNFKCPCCQEGDFFISHPYNFKFTGDIHENCSVCGKKYMLEPGFYQGAMYVAYGLGVVLFVSVWVISLLFFKPMGSWTLISVIAISSILLGPFLFSLSKIIYANLFIKFDKNAISNFSKSMK